MQKKPTTKMQDLLALGQSVWLDYLGRRMTRSGELSGLVDAGLRGMTSNPTIFEQAIVGTSDYADELEELASSPGSDREIFETIAIEDVREAADIFRPVYDSTGGADGLVSLEVSPAVGARHRGSVSEARRLWKAVDRPNVMIKIPGTREGWPAIERCLDEGININITLLFSVEHYRAVAEAYVRALESRVGAGHAIDRVASVASLFVSRGDRRQPCDCRAEEPARRALRSAHDRGLSAGWGSGCRVSATSNGATRSARPATTTRSRGAFCAKMKQKIQQSAARTAGWRRHGGAEVVTRPR